MAYTNPKNIAVKRALAQQLRGGVTPLQGNAHWAQALANIISPAIGGMVERKANEAEQANTDLRSKELQRLMNPPERMTPELAAALGGGSGDPSQAADAWNEEQANWTPSHPDVLAAQLGQKQRLEQIDAQNQRFQASAANNMYGVTDGYYVDDQNNILAEYKTGRDGSKMITDLQTGQPMREPPQGATFVPNASFANFSPSMIRGATPATAQQAGAEEEAEQAALTAGAIARDEASTEQNIRENQVTGTYDTDLENLTSKAQTAANAQRDIQALERAREQVDSPTGSLGNIISTLAGVFDSIGIPTDLYTDASTLQANSGEILARYMQELGARGLTDRDMDVLRSTLPNLTQSADARAQIIDVLLSNKRRDIDSYREMYNLFEGAYENVPVTLMNPNSQGTRVGRFNVEQVN